MVITKDGPQTIVGRLPQLIDGQLVVDNWFY